MVSHDPSPFGLILSLLASLYPLRPLAGGEPRIVAARDPVRQCYEQLPAQRRISEIERMIGTLVLAPLVLLESLRRTTTDGVPAIGRGQPRAA